MGIYVSVESQYIYVPYVPLLRTLPLTPKPNFRKVRESKRVRAGKLPNQGVTRRSGDKGFSIRSLAILPQQTCLLENRRNTHAAYGAHDNIIHSVMA